MSKYFVTTDDFVELLEFFDEEEKIKLTKERFRLIYRGILFYFIFEILSYYTIIYFIFFFAKEGSKDLTLTIGILLLIFLTSLTSSFFNNKTKSYNNSYIAGYIISPLLSRFAGIFPTNNKIPTIISIYRSYIYNITELLVVGTKIISVILVIVVSTDMQDLLIRFITLGLFLMGCVVIFSAKTFQSTVEKIYKYHLDGLDAPKKDIFNRWAFPAAYNLIHDFMFVLPAIVVLNNRKTGLLMLSYALTVENLWGVLKQIGDIKLTKQFIEDLKRDIREMGDKYVINKKSFISLCEKCIPNSMLLEKTKTDNSLILKDFIPMSYTNRKKVTHKYDFEFKPGIYQLKGPNGVGKTTLLKSLTLAENGLIETSRGEVAYLGKPFFDPTETLIEHRQKYIYLGAMSKQYCIKDIKVSNFDKFPNIKDVLIQIKNKEKRNANQSEGEKAVATIAYVYQLFLKKSKTKLLFIDESISRIYQEDTYPLRNEIISMIDDIKNIDPEAIIVVIDHMTEIPNAVVIKHSKHGEIMR